MRELHWNIIFPVCVPLFESSDRQSPYFLGNTIATPEEKWRL